MKTNPFYNAILALAYIVAIVSGLSLAPHALGLQQQSILYPMAALALLVLSVALMAYLFFYQPVALLLDGHREKAVKFFLQTVGAFAIGTLVILLVTVIVNGMNY